MSPVELSLSPASQTASTSSPLWAQPSKEWVIPAKPKPGRKPKKETSASINAAKDDADEESTGSRRVQNRQAAHAPCFQPELDLDTGPPNVLSGEIERNVALQNIAKKMKEENEELRKENQFLREKIAYLEGERDEFVDMDKKRTYDDTTTSSPALTLPDDAARKRARVDEDKQDTITSTILPSFPSSSPSLVPSADDIGPTGRHEGHPRQSIFPTPPPINNLVSFTASNEPTNHLDRQGQVEPYNCILCSPDAPCVCRQMNIEQTTVHSSSSLHQSPLQGDDLSQQSAVPLDQSVQLNTPSVDNMSILDSLPGFQASVPIRRRMGPSRGNPVFPVMPMVATSAPASTPRCSGDPDNCTACADDSFGKAFCQAIGHSVNSTLPCIDCPKRTNQTDKILVGGCCGDISKCGSCGIAPIISTTAPPRGPDIIPTDDAWHQLKSHPNVAFADLTLLAEVVTRRSKCTGSRVVISPAPGSATPDHNVQPHHEPVPLGEDQSVLLTDPHEHFHQKQRQRESPPQLVPQHVLIECGRRRVTEVSADGVKEALRLLDQKFAHMR
ncbi:hypothetical protein JVU11DRAFT_5253 [Chiua virens]|nr:hypothetical protein JVU11DRAFT_5253 [Chiua virens]